MMTDSQRLLIKTIQKESVLRNKNDYLLLKITQQHLKWKAILPNKINDVDVSVVNELLIKKILEYRQVRNYTEEEENTTKHYLETLHVKLKESKNKAARLMKMIKQKQEQMVQCCESLEINTRSSNIMTVKHLAKQHCYLLVELGNIISLKYKRSIKLFWCSEESRKTGDFQLTGLNNILYDDLQLKNKLLREKLADRGTKIQQRKNRLDEIIKILENTKKEKENIENTISKSLIPSLEDKNMQCLIASNGINDNIINKNCLTAELVILKKRAGILKYKYLASSIELMRNKLKMEACKQNYD